METTNGTKVLNLKWSRSIGAYVGTVQEPGWGAGSTYSVTNMWDKTGRQLGTYGNAI